MKCFFCWAILVFFIVWGLALLANCIIERRNPFDTDITDENW